MSPEHPTITCPKCARPATWKPEYAGRKAKCKCGQVFRYPAQPGGKATPVAVPTSPKPPTGAPKPHATAAGHRTAVGHRTAAGHKTSVNHKTSARPAAREVQAAPAVVGKGAQRRLEASENIESYDLATDDVCPSCLGVMKPQQVVCMTCGYNRNTGKKMPKVELAPETAPGGLRGLLGRFLGSKKPAGKSRKA
jgi:hypothetical protein